MYKNEGRTAEENRRKREDVTVQLRKNKRDDQLAKRRNLPADSINDDGELSTPPPTVPPTMDWPNALGRLRDPATKLLTLVELRKVLSQEPFPPIDDVITAGLVPDLVAMLKNETDIEVLMEVSWCITNVASGTTDQTWELIRCDTVPVLLQLVADGKHDELRSQAAWALGNIAGDCFSFRNTLLNSGTMAVLLNAITGDKEPPMALLRNAVWAVSNLNRHKDSPPQWEMVRPCIPVLGHLLKTCDDTEVISDCCWACSYISDGDNERIQELINVGLVPTLIRLLAHSDIKVVAGAVRAIGNVVTGDDVQTQAVLDAGVLPHLRRLLRCDHEQIHKEACWTISNIVAGNEHQLQMVLDEGIMPLVFEHAVVGNFKTRREATWAVANATSSASLAQLALLVDMDIFLPLCTNLALEDAKVLLVCLNGLHNLLRYGKQIAQETGKHNFVAEQVEMTGALDRLEALQTHPNVEVYNCVHTIMDSFFVDDDMETCSSSTMPGHRHAFRFDDVPKLPNYRF